MISLVFGIIFLVAGVQPSQEVDSICYDDLGCFTTANPWTSEVRPISALPEDPKLINTQFFLYTRDNADDAFILSCNTTLSQSPFDGEKKTIFLLHGWTHNSNNSWIRSSVQQILIHEDVNVISVDWSAGAGLPYLRALTNTQVVGAELSKLILSLTSKTHLELSRVHLIGHNLGAHAASYTGHRLYGLGRITGLDPSTIYFEGGDAVTYLDASDALFVDIIHSDKSCRKHLGLGFQSNIGHVDILVNNGQQQPGCTDNIDELAKSAKQIVTLNTMKESLDYYACSHMRVVDYFVESINSPCPFAAYSCPSWDRFQKGECYTFCRVASQCTAMGYHCGSYEGRGVFHLDTQASSPFCNTAITISADIDQSQPRTKGDINYILIGDVGQTKESTLKSGLIGAGNNFHTTVSVPGSNPLRIGHVNAVRMVFNRKLFKGKKVFVKKVKVYQANVTIEAVSTDFEEVVLTSGSYATVYPKK